MRRCQLFFFPQCWGSGGTDSSAKQALYHWAQEFTVKLLKRRRRRRRRRRKEKEKEKKEKMWGGSHVGENGECSTHAPRSSAFCLCDSLLKWAMKFELDLIHLRCRAHANLHARLGVNVLEPTCSEYKEVISLTWRAKCSGGMWWQWIREWQA
jgi:hypothetical protein